MTDATSATGQPRRDNAALQPPLPPASSVPASWMRRCFGDVNPLRVIGGLLLAVLVVAAAASAVIFFAAAQFQSRVAELSLNGAPLTIWRVDAFRSEFQAWGDDIRKLRKIIEAERQTLTLNQQNVIGIKVEQNTLESRLADDVRSLTRKVFTASPEVSGSHPEQTKISDAITEIELLLKDEARQKRFGSDTAMLRKRYNESEGFSAEIRAIEAKNESAEIRIKSLEAQLKDRIEAAAKLFGATNNNVAPELVERIVNITSELDSLSNIWRGMIYRTALWTNDMLVLLLLISMGVLGSALNLLAVFFTNEQDSLSFGEYPLRLAFGAVLAIVMFIIAKAGVPILADTTKIGGNAPLNPYFISLLAVVSGLMSDRAMGTIRNVATTLFQSVGGADFSQRYTRVKLDDALKTANRDVEGLAKLLGINVDDTKKLFTGNDLVSPDRQKLIAAYLGQSPRELYSDLQAG